MRSRKLMAVLNLVLGFAMVLPFSAAHAVKLSPYAPPGGDLSAAGNDQSMADWAEQELSRGLVAEKADRRSTAAAVSSVPSSQPAPAATSTTQVQAPTASVSASTATPAVPDVQVQPPSPSLGVATELSGGLQASNSIILGEPGIALDGVTVHGRRDVLQASDQRLKQTIDALPGLGAGGRVVSEVPLVLSVSRDLVLSAARQLLFQQPRVRGEASDEALFQAQTGVCTADAPFRCLTSDKMP